jgi:hypothetical protein
LELWGGCLDGPQPLFLVYKVESRESKACLNSPRVTWGVGRVERNNQIPSRRSGHRQFRAR